MLLDRLSLRMQITVVGSLLFHLGVFHFFQGTQFGPAPKRLKLTEVEFIEEVRQPPTEMEKLMNKLAAPKPEPKPETKAVVQEAIKELEKTSFRKVVGLQHIQAADKITEADLTHLAALPKFQPAAVNRAPAPALASLAPKIKLVRSETSLEQQALSSRVVPVENLPPADFGPADITHRGFQQPELIIKKVKAERQQPQAQVDSAKKLSLSRDSFITGEVKNREILHREFPPVPRWLEEKGVETEVVINFVVNPDGEVGDKLYVEKTSGYAELDRLAIEALKKFEFAPLPLNVKQAEQKGTIVIRFTFRK